VQGDHPSSSKDCFRVARQDLMVRMENLVQTLVAWFEDRVEALIDEGHGSWRAGIGGHGQVHDVHRLAPATACGDARRRSGLSCISETAHEVWIREALIKGTLLLSVSTRRGGGGGRLSVPRPSTRFLGSCLLSQPSRGKDRGMFWGPGKRLDNRRPCRGGSASSRQLNFLRRFASHFCLHSSVCFLILLSAIGGSHMSVKRQERWGLSVSCMFRLSVHGHAAAKRNVAWPSERRQ